MNTVAYIDGLNLSEKQRKELMELIFYNTEQSYKAGYDAFANKTLRYLDLVVTQAGMSLKEGKAKELLEMIKNGEPVITCSPQEMEVINAASSCIASLNLGDKASARINEALARMRDVIAEEQFMRGVKIGGMTAMYGE
jgi:hypothetical protein